MQTETPRAAPILSIAWTRYAELNASSIRRTRGYRRLRIWIAVLGVLATLFAILTVQFFSDAETLLGFVVKIFFIATPIVASLLAAFGTRIFNNGDWLVTRAAAEEYMKEIYFYRTVLQKTSSRRDYLEKRMNEIERQLFRGLGGELASRFYNGPVPPYFNPEDPDSDPGFNDITGDEYFRYRLEDQLRWHRKEITEYKRERDVLIYLVLISGGVGAFFAAWGGILSIWVALTASLTAALLGWQQLRNVDTIIKNYSKVVLELQTLYNRWNNTEPEERTSAEFYKMVRGCEDVLWAQNTEYIKTMQEALKESDLEQEASLVNRVIKESVESDRRTKQAMTDAVVDHTRETLVDTEGKVIEEFKETLGSLAEEASSDLVQQELEAMKRSVSEAAQTVMARVSSLTSSLAEIAEDFAHVDIGRDTSSQELNAILSRFPKSNDVKG